MKTKTTKQSQTQHVFKIILKYLRELSVVVVGIAITFLISNLVSNRNENKETQRYLNAVKMELEDNLEKVKEDMEFYERKAAFTQYLSKVKQADIDNDSLMKYDEVIRNFFTTTFKTSAFEMLKISGVMSLVKDKVLLQSILDTYSSLDETTSASNVYMNRKLDEIYKNLLENDEIYSLVDLFRLKNSRLYRFFVIHANVEDSFKDTERQINETLSLF